MSENMEIKTKKELMELTKEEIQIAEREAWDYFKRVKTVMKFIELEE